MEPTVVKRLQSVTAASPLHLARIEVLRRQYKLAMQEADAADKQAPRAARAGPQATSP
jgi:hypothetical protein